MQRLQTQLAVQAELAQQGDGFFGNFHRPNGLILYGQPNVGKRFQIQRAFGAEFDIRELDFGSGDPEFVINRLTDYSMGQVTLTTAPNAETKHRLIIIRHLEVLLRPHLGVEVQDYLAQAVAQAKRRTNTTIIGTLSGNIPTAFIPSLRNAFDFHYHCPLPTPEERSAYAKDLLGRFVTASKGVENRLTDEDWQQFVDASRYADYGLIRAFLRKLVCNVNGLWIANGKQGLRVIDGELLRRSFEVWDNQPCIVEADLQNRSMHTRNYAISRANNDLEYVPADTVPDPTEKRDRPKEEDANESPPSKKRRR